MRIERSSIVMALWLTGQPLLLQLQELRNTVPRAWATALRWLEAQPFGPQLLNWIGAADERATLENAVRKAREGNGLDVIVGDASAAKTWNKGFAVVSLVAVLEHLVDPGPALHELADLLTPDGLLYLLVGIFGGFAEGYVEPKMYVAGNAAATAGNVIANAGLLRLGIFADLMDATAFVFLALALYQEGLRNITVC